MTDLSKEILYEDSDMLVINKPAGLVVHPDGRTKELSVSEWFGRTYPESRNVGEAMGDIERHGVVHRIDRETSGILILAKTDEGHAHLKEQFQNREIEKIYHTFVYGLIKDDRGTINLPIGKSASDFRRWSAQRGSRGIKREAITYFQVLKRNPDLGVSLVEAKPKTGRTHQIRVHLLAIHHPVVADNLYASTKPKLLGFERLALHAREIVFKDLSGRQHKIKAEYPQDFKHAVDIIS